MEKLRITIPTPCHENWNEMTATARGRFCQVCEKEVVDFTNMSTSDILAFFLNRKSKGSVCSLLSEEQQKHKYSVPKQFTLLPQFRRAVVVTLIGLSVAGSPIRVSGQSIFSVVENVEHDTISVIKKIKEAGERMADYTPVYEEINGKKYVAAPGTTRVEFVPAEYKTMNVYRPKGSDEETWQNVETREKVMISIRDIQAKLKANGYYEGENNNILNEATEQALIEFRVKNGLSADFYIDVETLDLLGIPHF